MFKRSLNSVVNSKCRFDPRRFGSPATTISRRITQPATSTYNSETGVHKAELLLPLKAIRCLDARRVFGGLGSLRIAEGIVICSCEALSDTRARSY
jgi:hypothetical protein